MSSGQPLGAAKSAPHKQKELVDKAQGSLLHVSLQATLLLARVTSIAVGWGPA